jgi:hypothetical protein
MLVVPAGNFAYPTILLSEGSVYIIYQVNYLPGQGPKSGGGNSLGLAASGASTAPQRSDVSVARRGVGEGAARGRALGASSFGSWSGASGAAGRAEAAKRAQQPLASSAVWVETMALWRRWSARLGFPNRPAAGQGHEQQPPWSLAAMWCGTGSHAQRAFRGPTGVGPSGASAPRTPMDGATDAGSHGDGQSAPAISSYPDAISQPGDRGGGSGSTSASDSQQILNLAGSGTAERRGGSSSEVALGFQQDQGFVGESRKSGKTQQNPAGSGRGDWASGSGDELDSQRSVHSGGSHRGKQSSGAGSRNAWGFICWGMKLAVYDLEALLASAK